MNTFRLITALIMLTTAYSTIAQDSAASQTYAANREALFYGIYTDLVTQKDFVNAALNSLLAEGYKAPNDSVFFKIVAARARKNIQLSLRTSNAPEIDDASLVDRVSASHKEAERLYPEVAVPNSPLYSRAGVERKALETTYPSFFKNPNWPMLLTIQCVRLMTLESQEKRGQQAQPPLSLEQAKQILELQKLQNDIQKQNNDMGKQDLEFLRQLLEFGQRKR